MACDEGSEKDYIEVNIPPLLDKKIMTNVKTPQYLDSFLLFHHNNYF